MKSRVNFIFNAHLPFVRHLEYPKFLEEDWLFEAINESYIPLLRMMDRLKADGVPFKLTFSLSPTLCAMLQDDALMQRFGSYMQSRIELGQKEKERLSGNKEQYSIAEMYYKLFCDNWSYFSDKCNGSIINKFNELSNEDYIELVTSAATYAYLPLFKNYPYAVNAQIETGMVQHIRMFDKVSQGFWLPECGFYPGLENILGHNGVKWTSTTAESLFLSADKSDFGSSFPVKTPNGVYCFVRDFNLTSLVWSSSAGYPCDPLYREFYRDIGYDLPIDYIGPYIHEPEVRVFTGFKYWSITGNTADKKLYNVEAALKRVNDHAANFLYNIKRRSASASTFTNSCPVFNLSFDAELFGHRWFEGVSWLESTIRLIAHDSEVFLDTPSGFMAEDHDVPVLVPGFSSWFHGGYSQKIVDNTSNAYLIRYVFKSVERMSELSSRFQNFMSLKRRFLNQAARETLLLMSSDWPAIIYDNTSAEYAKKRITSHIQNLNLVYDCMCRNAVNTEWLVNAEKRNNIFPFIDYNIFSAKHLEEPSLVYTSDFS